jgi:hypothetical protein
MWQADNTNAYFAVTGHWIEERGPGEWTLEHVLLGFTQMNCSHSGAHLGQILFKILDRLQIVHKVRTLYFVNVVQLTCFSIGRPCYMRQCQEQRYHASRVRKLLSDQDWKYF